MPMSSTKSRGRPAERPAPTPRAAAKSPALGPKADLGPQESIGYLARYAYRAFVRSLALELAPHGILTGQWSVLRVLWDEEGLSQVDLADRMRVEKASLTSTLDGMERQGLIVRSRHAEDRRKRRIHLTTKGRRLKASLLPYAAKINQKATQGMSPADIETLRLLLGKVTANLDR